MWYLSLRGKKVQKKTTKGKLLPHFQLSEQKHEAKTQRKINKILLVVKNPLAE